jgi:hypothetical protein
MTSQRPRRPTAWEVSFPGESSEDENGDEEIVPEPDESEQEELAVLNGKRKTCSIVDDRVRFVPLSIPSLSWFMCGWNIILAGETPQPGTPATEPGSGQETGSG